MKWNKKTQVWVTLRRNANIFLKSTSKNSLDFIKRNTVLVYCLFIVLF